MSKQPIALKRHLNEGAVTERFLDDPNEQSFEDLFHTLSPLLVAYFRSRRCDTNSAEDLAQEVMLTVYLKTSQIRDRSLFRGWLYKVARNALWRHYGKQVRELDNINFADFAGRLTTPQPRAASPAFEFLHWMAFLDSSESEIMKLASSRSGNITRLPLHTPYPSVPCSGESSRQRRSLAPYLAPGSSPARDAVRPVTPRRQVIALPNRNSVPRTSATARGAA